MVLGVLWQLRGRLKPDGSLSLVMLAAYSFGRFFISWVREKPAVLGPLRQSHIISLALFTVAVALLAYLKVKWVKPEPAEVKVQEMSLQKLLMPPSITGYRIHKPSNETAHTATIFSHPPVLIITHTPKPSNTNPINLRKVFDIPLFASFGPCAPKDKESEGFSQPRWNGTVNTSA